MNRGNLGESLEETPTTNLSQKIEAREETHTIVGIVEVDPGIGAGEEVGGGIVSIEEEKEATQALIVQVDRDRTTGEDTDEGPVPAPIHIKNPCKENKSKRKNLKRPFQFVLQSPLKERKSSKFRRS